MKLKLAICVIIFAVCLPLVAQEKRLAQQPYHELPLSSIKPQGWLLNQLQIMAKGSTGHLDEMHPKLANDNGWLGGKGDGWEETPYWLDGAVPLAYMLNDGALKTKVLKYINWTLENQRPSGYFGPFTKAEREKGVKVSANNSADGDDWWPKMIMLKVLKQYYSATGDKRVVPFMSKYFNYQLQTLNKLKLGQGQEWPWAAARGADNAMIVQWLYSITKDKNLLNLASILEKQSFQWSTMLGNRDWVMGAAANDNFDNWMTRHGVNVAMGLKSPAINYQRTGDKKYLAALKTGWNDIMLLHGLPMGINSGDEDLHGNEPTQGVELCSIVETMFSMEEIIAITGDIQYMDALERMTYNALPAQTSDDYNQKQYYQMANQVQISPGVFDFNYSADRKPNVMGLRSGYTCCTSNMHQGWTKFTSHLWYASNNGGLAALEYAPCEIEIKINSQGIAIKESTNYPFEENVNFEFTTSKSIAFPLQLRIPSWCKEAIIILNGKKIRKDKGGQVIIINRTWSNNDKLTLQLPMEVTTSNWANNSRTIERGPLVYALKIGERWEKSNEPAQGDYYSVFPAGGWNYGLLETVVKNPDSTVKVIVNKMPEPFVWNQQNAPITITALAKKIPGWKTVNGVAHQPVTEREGNFNGEVSNEIEAITLIPYGCTKLRIVAFPVVK